MTPYELSKFQTATLFRAANDGTRCFIVMEPAAGDSEERTRLYQKDIAEMEDLIEQGLIVDVTENFATTIEEERARTGRGARVMSITDIGLMLFRSTKAREIVH